MLTVVGKAVIHRAAETKVPDAPGSRGALKNIGCGEIEVGVGPRMDMGKTTRDVGSDALYVLPGRRVAEPGPEGLVAEFKLNAEDVPRTPTAAIGGVVVRIRAGVVTMFKPARVVANEVVVGPDSRHGPNFRNGVSRNHFNGVFLVIDPVPGRDDLGKATPTH